MEAAFALTSSACDRSWVMQWLISSIYVALTLFTFAELLQVLCRSLGEYAMQACTDSIFPSAGLGNNSTGRGRNMGDRQVVASTPGYVHPQRTTYRGV